MKDPYRIKKLKLKAFRNDDADRKYWVSDYLSLFLANVFKVLRLLQKEDPHISLKYAPDYQKASKVV